MKKIVSNTEQDALAFQLNGLFYSEFKPNSEFNNCLHYVNSIPLRNEIQKYLDGADDKALKLEQIFNYLMAEPLIQKKEIIQTLIDEMHHLLAFTSSAHIKNFLVISCIQNINEYKISCYRTSYMLAAELDLDTASDLLQQILEQELETEKTLNDLSVEEFNQVSEMG